MDPIRGELRGQLVRCDPEDQLDSEIKQGAVDPSADSSDHSGAAIRREARLRKAALQLAQDALAVAVDVSAGHAASTRFQRFHFEFGNQSPDRFDPAQSSAHKDV